MQLVNDKEGLILKVLRVKSLAANKKIEEHDDVLTICNELLSFLDALPVLEKGVKLMHLVKDLHNFAHNI